MEYVTRDGVRLEVGRVARQRLDDIYIPAPVPPSRVVETWGGVPEEVPDYKDATYRREMHSYHVSLWRQQLRVISSGLRFELPDRTRAKLEAVRAMGFGDNSDADYLRFMVCEYDQSMLVERIFYLSTVTIRGIEEAVKRLNYTWRGKPIESWTASYTPGKRGALGVDMRSALRSGLAWEKFCKLSGPKQSQHVAFWLLEDRLAWLVNNGN